MLGQIYELKKIICEVITNRCEELCKGVTEKTTDKLDLFESCKEFLDSSQEEADKCVRMINKIMSSEDSEIIEKKDILGSEAQRIIQLKDTPCNKVAMEFKLDLSFKGIEERQSILSF